jgi:hypothetical protein
MRVLAPLFESAGVQVVFSGHEHNYQRAKPLRFQPDIDPATGKIKREKNQIPGTFAFDEKYDGVKRTKPNGVLYLTSGGGGQSLYHTLDKLKPAEDPYRDTNYHEKHSFTLVRADSKTLEMTQIDEDGKVVDHFEVSR